MVKVFVPEEGHVTPGMEEWLDSKKIEHIWNGQSRNWSHYIGFFIEMDAVAFKLAFGL